MICDYSNPIHLAGLYVEELKYQGDDKAVVGMTWDGVRPQIEQLIREGGIEGLTVDQVIEAVKFYGDLFAIVLNLSPFVTLSIFLDGLMHGMAVAAGLKGNAP